MKKILVITYYWPPSGGSGVQRWMYFCKHLSSFGYEPIVLTVSEKYASYRSIDESFLEGIKHVKTYKTLTFEPLRLYSLLTTGNIKKGIPQGHTGNIKKGLFYKISSYIRANYFIPDARIGWNKFAFKKARKIILSHNIETVITTGPPHSTHLIGLSIQREFGKKWIADFRDPWVDMYYNEKLNRTSKANNKDKELEAEVIKKADIILTVGKFLMKLLQSKTNTSNDKFKYIYNGFDAEKMSKIKQEKHSHFEISIIGTLTKNLLYKEAIKFFQEFIKNHSNENIKFIIAGAVDTEVLEEIYNSIPKSKIEYVGYVNHSKVLQLMKNSQLLVNIFVKMKNSEIIISGRHMEYISTGNPILNFGDKKGEANLIIKNIDNAQTFQKNEIEEAKAFVEKIFQAWKQNKPMINNTNLDFIKDKSRYETTRQLAKLINSI